MTYSSLSACCAHQMDSLLASLWHHNNSRVFRFDADWIFNKQEIKIFACPPSSYWKQNPTIHGIETPDPTSPRTEINTSLCIYFYSILHRCWIKTSKTPNQDKLARIVYVSLFSLCEIFSANNVHFYIFTYIHTYIHTYTHTYIHTYIYTYIHTYMYTHIHTYPYILT